MQNLQNAGGTVRNVNVRENHKWHTGSNPVLTTNNYKMKKVEKTKKIESMEDYIKFLHGMGNIANIFNPFNSIVEYYPYERLGDGYELRPIEIKESTNDGDIIENRENFSHLYFNGELMCDKIFRKGGMGGDFKDGYCSLIYYIQKENHTKKRHGFDFGTHVIINKLGNIVLSGGGISDYPSHRGGNVGKLKDSYYNLLNGQVILTASSSDTINSKNYIILEHRYDWYNKELPLGIYKIDKKTCSIEKIDDIK